MSEENAGREHVAQAPQAVVQTKRSFSIIWVVPIIALLIGGGLAYKAMSAKGPTITIAFETAEGLEANKTKIMFKDVEVGKVSEISLRDDLSGVVVNAEMHKGAEDFMTEGTQFWVVRARVAAGEVSGLGTLFSGAYIGINPSREGKHQRHFTGLEKPPVLTTDQPGQHFVLESKTLGSLDLGSPIYYRGIKVGKVVNYEFDEQAESVLINVFVDAPYHEKVRQNTRFWNASGIDLTMSASGIKVDTQSLVSILTGGVSFGLRQYDLPGKPAEDGRIFQLYPNQSSSEEKTYTLKEYFLMYFDQSVRGLSPGAPVEIKGIQVGEVVSVDLRFDRKNLDFRIPVLIILEPERLDILVTEEGNVLSGAAIGNELSAEQRAMSNLKNFQALIDKGFRAQLKTGSLLTGQLYIDIDFYPEAPPAKLVKEGDYPVFPTIPAPLEQIVQRVDNILNKVDQVPFDKIGKNLQAAIKELTATLAEIKVMSGQVNQETIPKVNATLANLQETLQGFQETLKGIDSTLGPDSALSYNTRTVTEELSMAIRSLRSLLEYLERNPQALILGKEGDKK
jgi:paraquat-inducible protein B